MTKKNELVPVEGKQLFIPDDNPLAVFLNPDLFTQLQRAANLLADSDLVPDAFKGKTANCFIALELSARWKMSPFMVMQSLYVVYGKPGIEGKMVIALVNSRGPFTGPIQFKFKGEGKDRQCTAFATHKDTGEECSETVTWKMVQAEGWDKMKKSQVSKWVTMPELMFKYRSATFLARTVCPEVLLGLQTADEVRDIRVIDAEPVQGKDRIQEIKDRMTVAANTAEPITDAEVVEKKTEPVVYHCAAEEMYMLVSINDTASAKLTKDRLKALLQDEYPEATPTVEPNEVDIKTWMDGDPVGAENVLAAARKKYNPE